MSRDIHELIEKMIDKSVKGADTYINDGSRWLIFTEEKRWIFELTKDGNLWYNYDFFEKIFKIISLNVVDNQHYITKWVEKFIRNEVKESNFDKNNIHLWVEETIQNGVIYTDGMQLRVQSKVEETIQNGVIYTVQRSADCVLFVEETIQNGVKKTNVSPTFTEYGDWLDGDERLDDIIKNGIKETWGYEKQPLNRIDQVIGKGEKTIWTNDTTKL